MTPEQRHVMREFSRFLHSKADVAESHVDGTYADGMRTAAIDAEIFELEWVSYPDIGETMDDVQRQNPDGSWSKAEPTPYQGWAAKLEQIARSNGWHRIANLLMRWDERRLGK